MQLHFQRQGQGPTVILIHGLFGSLENLGTLSRHLQTHFDVVSVDLINHGRSGHKDATNYIDMAGDIIETMDALNIERAHCVGHSMGGKVAMELAMLAPHRFKRIVVADIAPVKYPSHHVQVLKGLAALNQQLPVANRQQADQILQEFLPDVGVRLFLLRNVTRSDVGLIWQFNYRGTLASYDAIREPTSEQPAFIGPTLFIKGEQSDYILPEHRPAIMTRFPNATAKIIQGTGHWLHAEKPGLFNRLVEQFLLPDED
ncbi:alpha/beta fold hydrolase [Corallincola spongiicola]|uniref:Alpha/beta fold hydrolase n=1 Tax=Corallincola spongiicola TaxID=2520508 RepID=A0ABY1WUQ9_9GAMM|nr:alpha/beta fold hydrolase [Corallincola spongiicola]TAA48450.1 alpha/beta fold hydrolase [Corallincola spongiicola]